MTPPLPEVDARAAAALAEEGALLLDVREDDEWATGHAPQAVHRPLSRLTVEDVPADRNVVAVCRVGSRSGQVTAALVARGYEIVNLAGGMAAWAAAGLPVVRDDGTPGDVL